MAIDDGVGVGVHVGMVSGGGGVGCGCGLWGGINVATRLQIMLTATMTLRITNKVRRLCEEGLIFHLIP